MQFQYNNNTFCSDSVGGQLVEKRLERDSQPRIQLLAIHFNH